MLRQPRSYAMILFIVFFFPLVSSAQAKQFTSQYCEFQLPLGWDCALEGTEWVCQSNNEDRQKEAIIILAAKIRGDRDSLDEYQAYLSQTKTFMLPGGRTQVSEPKYARITTTNDSQQWVDALHLASEVPGFFTRYMATTKEDLGVAVTFSVAQDHYDSYQPVFEKIIESLRVFRQRGGATNYVHTERDGSVPLPGLPDAVPAGQNGFDITNQRRNRSGQVGGGAGSYLIWIILLAAAGFVVMKLRKKKGSAPKKKKKKKSEPKSEE